MPFSLNQESRNIQELKIDLLLLWGSEIKFTLTLKKNLSQEHIRPNKQKEVSKTLNAPEPSVWPSSLSTLTTLTIRTSPSMLNSHLDLSLPALWLQRQSTHETDILWGLLHNSVNVLEQLNCSLNEWIFYLWIISQ